MVRNGDEQSCARRSGGTILGWILAVAPGLSCGQDDPTPVRALDPAPPTVDDAVPTTPVLPGADGRTERHAEPRPLHPDAVTEGWVQFLGPRRDSTSTETRLDKSWPDGGPPLLWERSAGNGYAAPSIAGDHLIYFHRIEDEEVVECLHPQTGERYWEFRTPTSYRDQYGYSNGPRCSPLLDEDRVYTYGAQGDLHCLHRATGHRFWSRNLVREFEVPQDFFGVVATPVVYGDLLLVHVGSPGGPCVIALDKKTGRLRWISGKQWRAGYSSPVIAPIHGRDRLLVFAGGKSRPPSGGLICLDPKNGAIDFEFPFRSRSYESVNAACPVVIGNSVFVSASYGAGGVMLDLQADGSFEERWRSPVLGTHWATAIHQDGVLYGFDGRNEPDASLVCQQASDGSEVWREVLEWEDEFELNGSTRSRPMSVYRGTLIAVDGDFLCLGERGHLLWLDLSKDGCRELARTWLFGAYETWTPPILSRGLLYVCQNTRSFVDRTPPRLLCYDLRRQE